MADAPAPSPRARLVLEHERFEQLRRRVETLEAAQPEAMRRRITARQRVDELSDKIDRARASANAVLVDAIVNGGDAPQNVAEDERLLRYAETTYEQARRAADALDQEIEQARRDLAWRRAQLVDAISSVVGACPEFAKLLATHAAAVGRVHSLEAALRYIGRRTTLHPAVRAPYELSEAEQQDIDPGPLSRWTAFLRDLETDPEAAFPGEPA